MSEREREDQVARDASGRPEQATPAGDRATSGRDAEPGKVREDANPETREAERES